jgi:hypothetical protein
MISAFRRAHYVRYDESSATRLTDIAQRVSDELSGDLREIAHRSQRDVVIVRRMLKQFKEIGDNGADVGALAPRGNARLAAALVRASLDDAVCRQVAG